MNAAAARTVKVMRQARRAELIAKVIRYTGIALTLATAYALGYFTPRPMPMPDPWEPVIVYTGKRVHVGYMDDGGIFRNFEDGTTLKQVTRWKRP